MNNKQRKDKTLIKLENFSFDYDHNVENPVLKNINLTIEINETLLVVGPSGSGKSTLALCLNGLYPDAVEGWKQGVVYFKEQDVAAYEKGEVNQEIGVVFQDPESQFCMITVENELAFTMENLCIPREEMKERMVHVLEEVGLEVEWNRPIHELSGGQQQRLALASVLLLEPTILILDESTSNLDPMARLHFIRTVEQLKEKRNISIVVIDHHPDDWLKLIDRIIVLNAQGEIITHGSPHHVFYDQYKLLQEEGVHLPNVVNDVMNARDAPVCSYKNLPVTEQELAHFLLQQKSNKTLQSKAKVKEKQQMNAPILQLTDIYFSRKEKAILQDIQLEVKQGEFLAIVGKNGAGKSTLLHLLAGILSPDRGERTFLAKDYDEWFEHDFRKQIGFVFQNPEHQFITNTVFDELAFGMKLHQLPEEKIAEQVNELLETFGLKKHRWSNPFSLSGGQKRRLSVATMLDEMPKLLLFDEPTFGQDARTTRQLMQLVTHLHERGTSIVFVTHDMDVVDTYCERVVVVDKGAIIFTGSPDHLWRERSLLEKAHLRLPYRARLQEEVEHIKGVVQEGDKDVSVY